MKKFLGLEWPFWFIGLLVLGGFLLIGFTNGWS